ncbi:MAG: hypothetical protein QJR04_25360 [Burkholderia multivorans]|nr:hypothetical protein [Burkholderia multivorans]
MDENQQGRTERKKIERRFEATGETENLPYHGEALDAVQLALDGVVPGMKKTLVLTRAKMKLAKDAGANPDAVLHYMLHQLRLEMAADMVGNIAFEHRATPEDNFEITGGVICLSEKDFDEFLEALTKRVALAIGAAVEADRVTRAAQGDAA